MADEVVEEPSSSDDKLSRLPAHRDVWSQKELFERIISRHFQIIGELGGTRSVSYTHLTLPTILLV